MNAAPRTSAAAEVSVKNQPMKASDSSILAPLTRADRREYPLQDRRRRGRAAGNRDVDRDHVRNAPAARVALAEDSAGAAAVADRHHQLRVGNRLPGASKRGLHVARYGTGHEQQVGVAGTRDELDAELFGIDVGAVQGVDLQLAAVARSGVDVPDRERAPEMP